MGAKRIEISGLRGFSRTQGIDLAIPTDQQPGSGLTVIVGPNNAGKSTIVEALNALSQNNAPSFPEGKRNTKTDRCILIRLYNDQGQVKELRTVEIGGSETEWVKREIPPLPQDIFILPSRRTFNPFFNKHILDRQAYISHYGMPSIRGRAIDHFSGRIFEMQRKQEAFNKELKKVLDPLPNWTIEQADTGHYYMKFDYDGQQHNSDGLGEGLVSLFFIIDALYDSKPGDMIVIDEPELSLHPSLQKKLARVIADYAKDRQVVVATHSPYFIDWGWILSGARVVRVVRESDGIACYELSGEHVDEIKGFLGNANNPHILGLYAKEIFFLEDNVILVEGQEDVIWYRRIADCLGIQLLGEFFGWGVGGADNMGTIAGILEELGFRRVVGILDRNKQSTCNSLSQRFPNYRFITIPADDVRSKPPIECRKAVDGLIMDGRLKEEYKDAMIEILNCVNSIFGSCSAQTG